uniref:Uncharacterized protein n=1 Tax=Anguilla anguilla TaxID=7936 RepID=A0A0E9TKU3_ANGAN
MPITAVFRFASSLQVFPLSLECTGKSQFLGGSQH